MRELELQEQITLNRLAEIRSTAKNAVAQVQQQARDIEQQAAANHHANMAESAREGAEQQARAEQEAREKRTKDREKWFEEERERRQREMREAAEDMAAHERDHLARDAARDMFPEERRDTTPRTPALPIMESTRFLIGVGSPGGSGSSSGGGSNPQAKVAANTGTLVSLLKQLLDDHPLYKPWKAGPYGWPSSFALHHVQQRHPRYCAKYFA